MKRERRHPPGEPAALRLLQGGTDGGSVDCGEERSAESSLRRLLARIERASLQLNDDLAAAVGALERSRRGGGPG
jgi:hypothetical protein